MSLFKFTNKQMIQQLLMKVLAGLAVGFFHDWGKSLQPFYPLC
ncbi:hypothetical protein SAMN04488056_12815 [Cohaesibacter marisflavi]|uniref:Uncharacterized protein n=1 Tax=Cohaesibacter marisflavi TaxID=655353 RepID=A0A1I5NBG4_9HYPH|nr:hypothetical protein SAMN04488056_12815 [Cohaesibacter marisflavi]